MYLQAGTLLVASLTVSLSLSASQTQLAVQNQSVDLENGASGEIELQITRGGDLNTHLVVWYSTDDDSAESGTDYSGMSGYFELSPNSTSHSLVVPVAGRTGPEAGRQFKLNVRASSSAATPTFGVSQSVGGGSDPSAAITADINYDGRPDLVLTNSEAGLLTVRINVTTAGSSAAFSAPVSFSVGIAPKAVAAADLNGDGRLDLAVVNSASNSVSILLNETTAGAATAALSTQTSFSVGAEPVAIASADFDLDGKPDLVVANSQSDTISVLMNTTAPGSSTPTFARSDFLVGASPLSLDVGDLNRDGLEDVAVANNTSGDVSVLLGTTAAGTGVPTFLMKQDFALGGVPTDIHAVDLNGDAVLDLLVTDTLGNALTVLLNDTAFGSPGASFTAPKSLPVGFTTVSTVSADFNKDGHPDVAAAGSDGAISILINQSILGFDDLYFAPGVTRMGESAGGNLLTGDLQGDGWPDVAITDATSDTLVILPNTSPRPGNVAMDFAPYQFIGTNASAYVGVDGDFNNDGKPDVAQYSAASGYISFLINTTPPGAALVSVAKTTYQIAARTDAGAATDLNRDGRLDLLVEGPGDHALVWLLNTTPAGSLAVSFTDDRYAFPEDANTAAAGDLNGDGAPDVVVGHNTLNDGYVATVLVSSTPAGASSLTFSAQQDIHVPKLFNAVGLADINRDGQLDIVGTGDGLTVLLNATPAGAAMTTFLGAQTFVTGSRSPRSLDFGDMNQDGAVDVMVCHLQDPNTGGAIFINNTVPGSTTVQFSTSQMFPAGTIPTDGFLEDMDADGKLDMVVADRGGSEARIYINSTAPGSQTITFSEERVYDTRDVYSLAAVDMNSDGQLDLVGTGYPYTTHVLLNERHLVNEPAVATATINYLWTIPDSFSIQPASKCKVGSLYESEPVVVSGINAPAAIAVAGGEYSVDGGPYTQAEGTVNNGQAVTVRARSSNEYSATTIATLDIGGVSAEFVLTTRSKPSGSSGGAMSSWFLLLVLNMVLAQSWRRRARNGPKTTNRRRVG